LLGTEQAYDGKIVESGFVESVALNQGDVMVSMFLEHCKVLHTTLIACMFELVER